MRAGGSQVGVDGDDIVQVSQSRSIQTWLKDQIARAVRSHGYWLDLPGGVGRASRRIAGRDDSVLPVVLTADQAWQIQAGLLERANQTLFGLKPGEISMPAISADVAPAGPHGDEIYRDAFVHSHYAVGLTRTRALLFHLADYTGRTSVGPYPAASKTSARVIIPFAAGDTSVLTPQATYDFLYWAQTLAIDLDALDGIPSDSELTWWAIVQTAKDTVTTIYRSVKSGVSILTVGALVLGGALVIGLTRGTGRGNIA